MTQRATNYTLADLDRVIVRDYGRAGEARVKEILARYGNQIWHREVLRVHMACLRCADGDIARLERDVDVACTDYRDALVAAEYPAYMHAVSDEERRAAIESDLRQLESWLSRE
jgi:hypothetical protein